MDSRLAYSIGTASSTSEVPRQTIKHAIDEGELPAVRSGRRYIILREDFEAWLRRCRQRGMIETPVTQEGRERLAMLNRLRREKSA